MDSEEPRWWVSQGCDKPLAAAALQLGVSLSKLRGDAQSGRLRAYKKHSQWYVSEEEVERYRVDVLRREPIDYSLWRLPDI